MAKNPKQKPNAPSKKHLDRLHREQRMSRWITITTIVVVVAVILTIVFGALYEQTLKYKRSVAIVNGERISGEDFRSYTKYYRSNLIRNAQSSIQFANMLGDSNPTYMQSIVSQLSSISSELETMRAGQSALDLMIDQRLIIQESKKRGITVSPEEIEERMQDALNYYPQGSPTPTSTLPPVATSTLSPVQVGLLKPTETPAPTAVVTMTATPTPMTSPTATPTPTASLPPTVTPTPYTQEGYQGVYATMIADYKTNLEISEKTLRYILEAELYRQKLQEQIVGAVACQEEQVWAQHILVPDEALAKIIKDKLAAGEDWYALAAANSTDTSNKDQGGDLGRFGRSKMVKEFEDAAFALPVGQISEPVKTQFGFHIIRVLGHEDRPLTAVECNQMKTTKFQDWLKQYREQTNVQSLDFWKEIVPLTPTLPAEVQQILQKYGAGVPEGFPQQQP